MLPTSHDTAQTITHQLMVTINAVKFHPDRADCKTGIAMAYFNNHLIGSLRYTEFDLPDETAFNFASADLAKWDWEYIFTTAEPWITGVALDQIGMPDDTTVVFRATEWRKISYANPERTIVGNMLCSYNTSNGYWVVEKLPLSL